MVRLAGRLTSLASRHVLTENRKKCENDRIIPCTLNAKSIGIVPRQKALSHASFSNA